MNLNGRPLVLSNGLGVNSLATIVGLVQRGIRPSLNLFADVGAEKDGTYDYIPTLVDYLRSVDFPELTIVRYVPKRFKNWPPYYSLEENCLTNGTLPSISFGFSACSQKWKMSPQHQWVKQWEPAHLAWMQQEKVVKIIGYDASSRDKERSAKACEMAQTYKDDLAHLYDYWYPLQEWGWDRNRCVAEIEAAGLPVPPKSSCFFCIAMKPEEVDALPKNKLRRIVLLEARALPRLEKIEGLWRKKTKKRPGSMTQYILDRGLLSREEIEYIKTVPGQLIRFQKDYAEGKDRVALREYLARMFPEMYQKIPEGVHIVEVEREPTLFDILDNEMEKAA